MLLLLALLIEDRTEENGPAFALLLFLSDDLLPPSSTDLPPSKDNLRHSFDAVKLPSPHSTRELWLEVMLLQNRLFCVVGMISYVLIPPTRHQRTVITLAIFEPKTLSRLARVIDQIHQLCMQEWSRPTHPCKFLMGVIRDLFR